MATVTRQPFAPLDGARLQTLTSIKNRQNATPPAASKRKASELNEDDFENLDPSLFAKRSKASEPTFFTKDFLKSSVFLTSKPTPKPVISPPRTLPASPRRSLNSKLPVSRLNTSVARSSPLAAPTGRSPTRGKRSGILSRRRTSGSGSYSRVEPPSFNVASAVPFSLDAALKGTIPSYAPRNSTTTSTAGPIPTTAADVPTTEVSAFTAPAEMKASWFFDIHEDTPDQEMTNLLQHGTCILDISSDEESVRRARDGRDKENIPPADDVSQTSSRRAAVRRSEDEMIVEKERFALADLDVEGFYGTGCDASSVIIVPADDDDGKTQVPAESEPEVVAPNLETVEPQVTRPEPEPEAVVEQLEQKLEMDLVTEDVDVLVSKADAPTDAAVLEPMEGTGETFELWESGSAKDEGDGPGSPAPVEFGV